MQDKVIGGPSTISGCRGYVEATQSHRSSDTLCTPGTVCTVAAEPQEPVRFAHNQQAATRCTLATTERSTHDQLIKSPQASGRHRSPSLFLCSRPSCCRLSHAQGNEMQQHLAEMKQSLAFSGQVQHVALDLSRRSNRCGQRQRAVYASAQRRPFPRFHGNHRRREQATPDRSPEQQLSPPVVVQDHLRCGELAEYPGTNDRSACPALKVLPLES
jgi:hypothetical protein